MKVGFVGWVLVPNTEEGVCRGLRCAVILRSVYTMTSPGMGLHGVESTSDAGTSSLSAQIQASGTSLTVGTKEVLAGIKASARHRLKGSRSY